MIDKHHPLLRQYMNEINHPLLTVEEEVELSKRKDAGCELAFEALVKANLRLVVKIAYEFSYSNVDIMDLISEGNIGLLEGMRRYDHTKGRVISYIPHWIRKHIKTSLNSKFRAIKIPNHTFQKVTFLCGIVRSLENENGFRPSWQEVAEVTGTSEKRIKHIMEVSLPLKSMQEPVGQKGEEIEFGLLLADENAPMPYEGAQVNDAVDKITEALEFLPAREREVIEHTYGLNGREQRSRSWMRDEYGVSRQRIAQIQEQTIAKLNKIIRKLERTNSVNR